MDNDLSLYLAVRDKIQSGDHIGYQGTGIISRMIRWFGGEINHSEIAVKLDYDELKDRRFTLAALNKGIEFHLLSETLRKYRGKVYWYPLKPEYNHLRNRIAAWAFAQLDTPYDYRSLFRNALGRVSSDMQALFCSEYVNFALVEGAGIDTGWPLDGPAPRPADIEKFSVYEKPVRIL